MLVTSIFSFSHYVFKRQFPHRCQKLSLFGKGLSKGAEIMIIKYLICFIDKIMNDSYTAITLQG